MAVRVQAQDFDIAAEIKALQGDRTDIGAIVTFTGTVRGTTKSGGIANMTLEHYPGMTEAELARVEAEAHCQSAARAERQVARRDRARKPVEPARASIGA